MIRFSIAAPMFFVGLAGLALTAPKWGPAVDGETRADPQPKKVKPFSDRMRCPKWKEGLARTVVVTVKEDERGNFLGARCERPQEATK